jgi:hypothetical protein
MAGDLASLTKAVNMMDSSSGPQLKQVQQRAVFLKDLLQILMSTATAGRSKAQCQWKVKQLQLAAYNANRQLGEVKADVLLLASGKEQNVTAAKKLKQFLPSCTVRFFKNSNPALLLVTFPSPLFKCRQSSLISSCCGGKPTHNTHYFPSCII